MINFLKIKPSLSLFVALLLFHLAAVCLLYILSLAVVTKIILLLICCCSLFYSTRHCLLFSPQSVVQLESQPGGRWVLRSRQAGVVLANVLPSSVVTRYFMMLYFKPVVAEATIPPVVICFDSMRKEDLWHLRRQLKLNQL